MITCGALSNQQEIRLRTVYNFPQNHVAQKAAEYVPSPFFVDVNPVPQTPIYRHLEAKNPPYAGVNRTPTNA
jgi:hypothetical protein